LDRDKIRDGAESVGRTLDEVELTVSVGVEFTDDVHEASQRHAQGFAFTFGAMGSASSNFYNDAFARQGWGDDVDEVQRLWFAGDRDAAAKRVPAEIGRRTNLIGPPNEIRSRLREYRDCGVTTLRIGPSGDTLDERVANLGQIAELVADVNNESQTGAPLT
jgi:alkanesulfonate monooxygenase SsuD/methylene tetrahydromethanopterin reductase-like flavin-dependent oxidoreductase (luciferase family)